MKISILITFLLYFCFPQVGGHEFYSSTDEMSTLVAKETELLNGFRDYITAVEENLLRMKRVLLILDLLSEDFPEDNENLVKDPVAAYKLMRRLRVAWKSIVQVTMQSSYEDYIEQLDSELLELPDQEDLDGAALGLIRLQEIYLLRPENITKGTLTGKPSPLNPDEAYHLARVAYEYEKFQHAFLWAYESLKQKERGITSKVSFKDVLTVLSSSSYEFGHLPLAVLCTEQLLKLDPTDEQVRYRLKHYKLLKELRGHIPSPNMFTLTDPIFSSYEALCRGEDIKKTPKRQRALSCRYSTGGGNPRLIYAPVKEEEVSDNPPIIRYYDILSEKEIEILKSLSRPELTRSGVTSEAGDRVTERRVSKSAVLYDEEDPVIGRVNQRIADITGLDMESSELLQVANYGIGGRFEPHYDAKWSDDDIRGGRMATVLIYLSDVEVGGATVFPEVGVALKPQKGSAVLWFNLLRNGRMDDNALHAGCPVFIGNKWIATKWIRERGQEFRRPCSLSESE